jgi:hypothetical protein
VTQNSDGGWRVERDGIVIADGLSNAAAWREADRLDTEAEGMEETRRRISIAVGQW